MTAHLADPRVLRCLAQVARVASGDREQRVVLLLEAMAATARRGDVLPWLVLRGWLEVVFARGGQERRP